MDARILSATLLCLSLHASAASGPGAVEGRVRSDLGELSIGSLGPVVVYLEPLGFELPPAGGARVAMHQRGARFSPDFLVVPRGARLDLPNDDPIFHNVFSYSPGNEFDVGIYGQHEVRGVTLGQAGSVRVYCSIHEAMNGTVFVAPNPLFDVARADGRFAIPEVPAGRYRLSLWSPKLPPVERELEVGPGRATRVAIPLRPERGS